MNFPSYCGVRPRKKSGFWRSISDQNDSRAYAVWHSVRSGAGDLVVWYDWRLDLAESADALHEQINQWFGPDSTVNLVAHSMGGLVSRTFILRHPDRWAKGGILVMLGTPNHGSFTIPEVITGALDTVRKITILDVTHNRTELLSILNTFPGSLQMLPSPLVLPGMAKMYDQKTWERYAVTEKLLDIARSSHQR